MKYDMKKALTAAVLAALAVCAASCGQQQAPAAAGTPADTTAAAAESADPADETESVSGGAEEVTEAQPEAKDVDPMTADYSKIDIEIPADSGEKIVEFTNDMLAGKYDGKIVRCTGRTSRRMNGNAMMQEQPDGTSRGFTWYLADNADNSDAYPPEDAVTEITGVVGIGDYDVRYLYVPSANVKIVTGEGAESEPSSDENTVSADDEVRARLTEAAKAYYAGNHDGYMPSGVNIEPQEDGTYAIQIFDDLEDHTATLEWYFVDPTTMKGKNLQDEPVDLGMSGGSESGMGYEIPSKITPEPWDPPVVHRQVMLDEGEFFGVKYIGWIDPKVNDFDSFFGYIDHILDETGTYEDFEFTKDMPHDRFVSSENGQELYLVIPFDREGSVYVVEQAAPGETPGEASEWMYHSNDGAPFLLKCNISDIFPDVKVIFVDSSGDHAEWYPGISGRDGTVITTNDTDKKVHDFTIYDKLSSPDSAPLV